ncbi:MAG: multicopper oxidase family protein [Actinomycetota bacterium]|nr:multicopper oxidase family protein [Actinomycetota bacterium]
MNTPLASGPLLSRRSALRLTGLGALAAGVAACSNGNGGGATGTPAAPDSSVPLPSGAAFVQPAELVSANGRLEVTLEAAPYMASWNGATRYALAYNGSVPGPTLRARPGDTIRLTLRNGLDQPTNLHTHGLHVSPEGYSDNIFHMIDPGGSLTYEYELPGDHPSGTFWYHPHHHGFVAAQVSGGLAGAIIIEDDIDDSPVMRASTERVLIISDPKIGTDESVLTVTSAEQNNGREGDAALINGVLRPVIDAETGTVERWRIINASSSRYYRLTLSGASMSQIASDHGRFGPIAVGTLLLTPGQRAEVLVSLNEAGTITLSTEAVARGMSMGGGGMGMGGGGMGMGGDALSPAADLLTVVVTGPAGAAPGAGMVTPSLEALDSMVVDAERHISFGAMGMGRGEFVIDGKPFAADRVDADVLFGTTEDWIVTNNSMMPHPFHLHVWPFRVVERSDGSEPDPGWRDTVNIPTGQSVRLRIPFRDFSGTTVYHCHILDHEDLGMMAIIDV